MTDARHWGIAVVIAPAAAALFNAATGWAAATVPAATAPQHNQVSRVRVVRSQQEDAQLRHLLHSLRRLQNQVYMVSSEARGMGKDAAKRAAAVAQARHSLRATPAPTVATAPPAVQGATGASG